MKRKQKKLLGLLLACTMVCLPVSQSLAAVSYDASVAVSNQILFPGDSLINVAEGLPILVDGEAAASEVSGTWTNDSTDKVYTAVTAEDGTSIQLSAAGYVLVVERGESRKNDEGADNSWNHYTFSEDERPEIPQDRAFYASGETVKLKADEPEEGMVFAGWKADSDSVSIADPASAETTLVMPEKKVTVTALYEEAQAETTAPEETDPNAADPTVDPGEGEPAADPTVDPGEGEPAADPTVDPGEGEPATDPTADPGEGEPAADPTVDPEAGEPAADPSVEVIGDPLEGGDQNTDLTIENADTLGAEAPVEVYNEGTAYNVFVTDGFISEETGAGPYVPGTVVKVNANDYTPDGLAFDSWSVDSLNAEVDLGSASAEFYMPEGDVYLTAHYKTMESEEAEAPVNGDAQSEPQESENQEAEPQQPDTPAADPVANTYEVVVDNGTGSGTYAAGETVTVEAQEIEGQTFSTWKTDNEAAVLEDPTQAITTFTMPETPVTVTAEYTAETKTEAEEGNAQDPVNTQEPADTPDPSGTPNPAEPANPQNPGNDGQPGDDSQTPVTTTYGLTLPADASVKIADIESTGAQDNKYTVEANAKVEVTATAREGYTFTGWTAKGADGADVELTLNGTKVDLSQTSLTFNMPGAETVIDAVYETTPPAPSQYTIKVANGTVSGATANADGSWTVVEGTQIVVTANPAPAGEAFSGWRITDGNNADVNLGVDTAAASITLTPAQNLNFQANYTGVQYSVSVTNGTANYATAVSGTSVTITANGAPAGMEFDSWSVTSGNVSLANAASATTTFTMPAANVTVAASYRQKTYSLTVKNGSADADRYYMDDEPVISSNYPETGKEFAYWEAESGNVEFEEDYLWQTSFTMPASDVTVAARYKNGPSTDDNKILDIVEGGEYYTGSTIKFTASGAGMDKEGVNPGDYRYRPTGYSISNVNGTWQSAPYTTSMAIKAVGDYTLKVNFSKEVYDGGKWTADGTTDTKTVTFRVVNNTSVLTGDNTPIMTVALIAGAALIIFLILLVVIIRRRRK